MPLGRNEPCWCGSGKKFKRCHLNRPNERVATSGEIDAATKRAWNQKQCMHPEADVSTCGAIIQAHTLQRSAVLRSIANASHKVGTFYPVRPDPGGHLRMRLVGWRDASTFAGFCAKHDDSAFAALEKSDFDATPEQCFLLGYRAVCHELYQKQAATRVAPIVRRHADRGLPFEDSVDIQSRADVLEIGTEAGLRDIKQLKARMDRAFLNRQFDTWESRVINFTGDLCFATTGVISPNLDLRGREIQRLHRLDSQMEAMTVAVVSRPGGGSFVLGWEKGSRKIEMFVESVESMPWSTLPSLLVQYSFAFLENTYFDPEWWNQLSPTARGLVERHARTINAYYNLSPLENETLVSWRITEVLRIAA